MQHIVCLLIYSQRKCKCFALAESADHLPEIFIYSHKKKSIELMTHSKGKITEKDYDLAKGIDLIK